MIQHLENIAIDKAKWDHCITNAAFSPVYAKSWYLDLACDNWDALVEDDYAAVMPLPWRKKGGIKYIYPPYFIQQLGIFSENAVSCNTTAAFINAIPPSFGYAEMNLNHTNDIDALPYEITKKTNLELRLESGYDAIRSAYSDNLKRNLRKAENSGITISEKISISELVALFQNNKGAELGKFGNKEYGVLQRIFEKCLEERAGSISGIINSMGKLLAGAFFIHSDNRKIFLFSGASAEAKETAGIPFLLDREIKASAGQPSIFDFEGSSDKNLARFYKGFGSEETYYHSIIINRLPKIAKYAIKWRHLLKKN